jgi:hypothetical protein
MKRAGVALSLGLAGCTGGESLPDDPRPPASAEAVVPPAAVSAVLSPDPPMGAAPVAAPSAPGLAPSASPTVIEDPPDLSRPGLPPEVVTRITRQHRGALLACYASASGAAAPTAVTLTIRYVVGPTGAVTSASTARSTLADPTLGLCVADVFRHLAFPSPTGPALVVTQTLYFGPPPP